MTSSERAKYLVEKFYKELQDCCCTNHDADGCNDWDETKNSAKQCAIIAIGEIIDVLFREGCDDYWSLEYWQQVGKEIEKL